MPTDSGFFQINDIELNIPPQHITVDRKSSVFQWQTLRTRSSTKTRSGFSTINIEVRATFTNSTGTNSGVNGFQQLRDLVAQLRVTPFCYVENKYLRNSILGGSDKPSMVLALRQLQIIKDNSTTNTVTTIFSFSWFNYFPFLREWSYKTSLFLPTSSKDPRKSGPWRLMYRAEQKRGRYSLVNSLQDKSLGRASTVFEFTQFASMTVSEIKRFEKEKEALFNLRKVIKDNTNLEESRIRDEILTSLKDSMGSEPAARRLQEETFGHMTSFKMENIEEIISTINKAIDPGTTSKYGVVVDADKEWKLIVMKTGKLLKYKGNMQASRGVDDQIKDTDILLASRKHKFDLERSGLHIVGISISFENILAELPLVGHPYPTFQHIGSIDAVVQFSISTISEQAIRDLSKFYSIMEDQPFKFRNIPQGQQNVVITNKLLNMCGLRDFMPNSIAIATAEGQPGTYNAMLSLVDNPITSETREELIPSSLFASSNHIRNLISEVLLKNLKLADNAIIERTLGSDEVAGRASKDSSTFLEIGEAAKDKLKATVSQVATEAQWVGTYALSPFLSDKEIAKEVQKIHKKEKIIQKSLAPLYQFAPSGKTTSGDSDAAFRQLCEEYGSHLGEMWRKMLRLVQKEGSVTSRFGVLNAVSTVHERLKEESIAPIIEFFSLTNDDVFGIQTVQRDIKKILSKQQGATGKQNSEIAQFFKMNLSTARKLAREQVAKYNASAIKTIRDFYDWSRETGKVEASEFQDQINRITKYEVNSTSAFINEYLNEWITWSAAFLDSIIYGGFIDLDQFKDIKDIIRASASSRFSTGCYPDFPLREVVGLIREEDSDAMKQVFEELQQAAEYGDFGLGGIGYDALIEPDFYMYNKQNDDVSSIIPIGVQQRAVTIIQENQTNKMIDVESNWLENIYEKDVLGNELAQQIRNEKDDVSFDKSFWGLLGGDEKDIRNIVKNLQATTKDVYHYNDLTDPDGYGLGCSILEEENATTQDDSRGVSLMKISLDAMKEKNKIPGSVVHRERPDMTLKSLKEHHSQVKHSFNTNSIAFKSAAYYQPPQPIDPKKKPRFAWPIDESVRVVGKRGFSKKGEIHPVKLMNVRTKKTGDFETPEARRIALSSGQWELYSRSHDGQDFPHGGARNIEIKAAADGRIEKIRQTSAESANAGGYGNYLYLKHSGGWQTRYGHMKWDGHYGNLSRAFYAGEVTEVKKGQVIGYMGTTGSSTGVHLHFEIRKPDGTAIDPIPEMSEESTKSYGPLSGLNPANESLFTKSVDQLEKDLANGQGYSLMRAYPTFKLFFIESDLGERKKFGFDDFFNYSAVESIKVIRSRKIAADLVILNLTNVSGVLTNRKFRNVVEVDEHGKITADNGIVDKDGRIIREELNATTANTVSENPISSLMLQPGVQIQLRLGYTNHPNELETVFNGVVTDVRSSENDDMVQVVCQSFAIEMVQNQHGEVKSFGGFFSGTGRTGALLEELLALPEVVHFGRWEGGPAQNTARGILKTSWRAVPTPVDDNIFAPLGRGIFGLFDSTTKYLLYQNTIWDVFQEMTLRHPAYIASVVPYQGKWGPRMTAFFGVPDQMYYARDPTLAEDNSKGELKKFVREAVEKLRNSRTPADNIQDPSKKDALEKIKDEVEKKVEDANIRAAREFWLKKKIKNFALDKGFIKPFRSYHVATSTQHILMNNIESSIDAFNTCTLQYGSKDPSVDEEASSLVIGNTETFTLRCDAGVQDEDVKEMFAQYPNCVGYEMAKRYAVGLLYYSLKECYRGSLIIIGNPKIKPYDIVYVFDEYSDMFGPLEVEQVVHEFSQRRGFITEITPDMVVHVNQLSTLSSSDAMGLVAEHALRSIGLQSMPSLFSTTNQTIATAALGGAAMVAGTSTAGLIAGAGAAALAFDLAFTPIANMFYNSTEHSLSQDGQSAFGMIGSFIFKKLITRTQLAHPFRYSPLVKNGRAMVGALPNRKIGGGFIQGINQWMAEGADGAGLLLSDFYDTVHPNNWLGAQQGSLFDTILGRGK